MRDGISRVLSNGVVIGRGVSVFTGETAEHYPAADYWTYDDKGALDIFDPYGRCLATFLVGTWLRVEAGPYNPTPSPAIPS